MASRAAIVRTAIDAAVDQVAKRIVLGSVAELVKAPSEGGTPVDTGHARSNWIPSVGRPVTTVAGSREAVTFGAQAQGIAAVAGRKPEDAYQRIYIQNNVPYIQQLNFGHSQQAPAGFVEAGIARAVDRVAKTPLTIAVRVPEEPKA